MVHKVENVPTASSFPCQKRNLREKKMPIYPRVRHILQAGGPPGLSRAPREPAEETRGAPAKPNPLPAEVLPGTQ